MRKIQRLVIGLACTAIIVSACHRGGGTVRHGNLSYNATDVFDGNTSALELAEAAGRGDAQGVQHLVAGGANPNTVGKYGITPLWWAAWTQNFDGFRALLNSGANPNFVRTERFSIMELTVDLEDPRFLEAALKHGGNPNLPDSESGLTPLFTAVQNDRKPQIELLLTAKADVNVQMPISGMTLPMVAIGSRSDYKLAYRLLEAGADPTKTTKTGHTLADTINTVSVNSGNNGDPWRAKIIDYLQQHGVKAKNSKNELQTPTNTNGVP
jgi:ankyrin repeat protein